MCTYSVCSEFLVLRTKSSASMALTKKKKKKKKKKKPTTKQNNPPPQKKTKKTTKKQQKKQQKNSNKLITKTDKTQQTNVALATARAYKIYVTNVSVFLLFLFIVSSIWGKMVLKPYSGCRGFALIRLFFGGGFARSALFYGICVQWLFSENLKIQNVVCDTTFWHTKWVIHALDMLLKNNIKLGFTYPLCNI